MAMNFSPLGSSRNPERPPKPLNFEVRTTPLRYCSDPNLRCERSRRSKEGIGRASISIETGAFAGGGSATAGSATVKSVAAVATWKKRQRDCAKIPFRSIIAFGKPVSTFRIMLLSGVQSAPRCRCRRRAMGLAEQLGELFGDGTTEFLGIHDGHRAAIVARDIVTDADREQLDRRAGLDFLDDVAQMPFEVIARIDRQRGI